MVFYSEEPWGFEADAFRSSQIAATVVNTTPRGRGARVFKAGDFYHKPWEQSGEGLSEAQMDFIRKRKKRRKKVDG